MIHELKLDKKELRFLREAVEREQERLLAEQKQNDEDSDAFAELGNDAMVYQTIIDKIDALLLKLPEDSR
ncbi:MAG: hypothetical protein QM790_05620 [Nibricoccus sp.]